MSPANEFGHLVVDTCHLLRAHAALLVDADQVARMGHLEDLLDAARPVSETVVALPLRLAASVLAQLAHAVARVAAAMEAAGADARTLRVRIDHLHHERDQLVTRLLRQGRGPDSQDERMSP